VKVGTILLIKKTGSGCLGAETKIGIVTDEAADHGIAADRPGYNVATFGMGHIWRINPDAEVKILYRPHE
jgi:hypothetical protein